MWLFFHSGVVSVVCGKRGESKLCVRARVATDLAAFRRLFCPELSRTTSGGGSDYPFRAWVLREAMAVALGRLALALDYPNFKAEVARRMGKGRASIYSKVWSVLIELEGEAGTARAGPTGGPRRRAAPRKGKSAGGGEAGDAREGG